ncbi:MAG: nuclear transport factor 2 family protein [Verrucomicrobia bacterium]|nr:nuclear transport factor 2 family protein [Verrucomicrobiota bacterium]
MKDKTFTAELPACVTAYFAAANAGDAVAAAASFAPDAVVHDENRTHRGPATIAAWIEETSRKYQPVVEPLHWVSEAGRHRVTGKVSGAFPGSPVELDFEFTVADGKILQLAIQ